VKIFFEFCIRSGQIAEIAFLCLQLERPFFLLILVWNLGNFCDISRNFKSLRCSQKSYLWYRCVFLQILFGVSKTTSVYLMPIKDISHQVSLSLCLRGGCFVTLFGSQRVLTKKQFSPNSRFNESREKWEKNRVQNAFYFKYNNAFFLSFNIFVLNFVFLSVLFIIPQISPIPEV